MNLLFLAAAVWLAVGAAVALAVGKAIKLADQREVCCPLHAGDQS